MFTEDLTKAIENGVCDIRVFDLVDGLREARREPDDAHPILFFLWQAHEEGHRARTGLSREDLAWLDGSDDCDLDVATRFDGASDIDARIPFARRLSEAVAVPTDELALAFLERLVDEEGLSGRIAQIALFDIRLPEGLAPDVDHLHRDPENLALVWVFGCDDASLSRAVTAAIDKRLAFMCTHVLGTCDDVALDHARSSLPVL